MQGDKSKHLFGSVPFVVTIFALCGVSDYLNADLGAMHAAERFTASQESILWAHEYGNNQGLPYHTSSSNNLMLPSIGTYRRRVNQAECNTYGGTASLVATASVLSTAAGEGMALDPMVAEEADPTRAAALDPMIAEESDPTMVETETASEEVSGRLPVEKFVTQIYIHGLPLNKAAQFGEKAIEPLLQVLSDPCMVRYHENAALTLGIIGNEKALAPLIAYVEQGPSGGEVADATEDAARAAYKGRVGAVMGLGYLANLTGSEEAVEFLIRHSRPTAWSEGMLETLPPRRPAARDPRESLTNYAIIALGFSGSDNAVAHLRTLMDEGTRVGASGFIAEQADVIENSLQIFEDVSEGGLLEYYAQPN